MGRIFYTALGLLAAPFLGGLLVGLDRILTARLQSRIGPPLFQPFYDLGKLWGKSRTLVNPWQAFGVHGYLAAASIALALFGLQSDLLLILFVQAVGTLFLVIGALASGSPYSQIGAHRELLQVLAYEPLLLLVPAGIYLETHSFRIVDLYQGGQPLLFRLPLLFLVLPLVLTIKLRKSPFDFSASHQTHQELVRGILTDYSGPYLCLIEVAHYFEMVLILGICSLFWTPGWAGQILLPAAAFLVTILIDNSSARLNWRWLWGAAWGIGLPLCLLNMIWIVWGY
ncbi:MAG: NADH-quinone oxidoreductase subunit H [Desulfobacterota bacterium]|nr:NADH-quinone oxidoreductase subunit H [Thermodesulfobacteriota bacterium]